MGAPHLLATERTMADNKNELLCSYACMMLADSEAEVSADNINAAIAAAGASVPPFYAALFEKVNAAAEGGFGKLIENSSKLGGGGGGGGGGAPAAGGAAPAAAAKKESSSEEEMAAGPGLFDDAGDDY